MGTRVTFSTAVSPHASSHFHGGQILNRQAAKSRLQVLMPGTEEHLKLQEALIRKAGIIEINLPTSSYRIDPSSEEYVILGGFGSSEHVAIGEAVKLKGLPEENTPLLIKGLTSVQFQHIIALAGDFYGVAGEAISLPGGTDAEKTQRFKKAFETLAQADNNELRRVILEIDHECTDVRNSSLPHHCYSSQLIEKNNAIKKIKSDINELLIDNSDHFSTNAEDAYRIGHAYALSVARDAGKRKDIEGLKQAYALDAYACHFLTDLFASGHIRNQRGALEAFLITHLGFSAGQAKPLAGILTGAQHEKDGNEGLNVANGKGEQWRAYGDGSFFTPKNKDNKEKAISAVQQSVNEIYTAFVEGGAAEEKVPAPSIVIQLIPHVTPYNPPPLYSIEGNSLFLNQGSDQIHIESKSDYLTKGISLALRYLPEEYISGFLAPFHIQIPPLLDKVIIPQWEHITGCIWHTLGLATYYQARKESEKLNGKIDEMADALLETHNISVKSLEQMRELNKKMDELLKSDLLQEIRGPISTIKALMHQNKNYGDALSESQFQHAERALWDAQNLMSSVFCNGTADGREVLLAYSELLKASQPSLSSSEFKISITLWFRQMVDYQVQAFSLWALLQFKKESRDRDKLPDLVGKFQKSLKEQIEKNKAHVDEKLVYKSQSYIAVQLGKSKLKRVAFSHFNPST